MSLDMYGFVDPVMNSELEGGVTLITPVAGGYTGPGGLWEDGGPPTERELKFVNVQQASLKTAQHLDPGGTTNPSDLRVVHINDGVTYLQPDDDGSFAQTLRFTDGVAMRTWRVRHVDNRPHRNYCRAIVERYRGTK